MKANGAAAMYYLVGFAHSPGILVPDIVLNFHNRILNFRGIFPIPFNFPGNCAVCSGSLHRRCRTHRLGVGCSEKGSRRRAGASDPLPKKVAHMTCLPSRLDIYKGHMLDKVGITVYLINIGIQAVQ